MLSTNSGTFALIYSFLFLLVESFVFLSKKKYQEYLWAALREFVMGILLHLAVA